MSIVEIANCSGDTKYLSFVQYIIKGKNIQVFPLADTLFTYFASYINAYAG